MSQPAGETKRAKTKRSSSRLAGGSKLSFDSPEGLFVTLLVLLFASVAIPAMIPSVRASVTSWASSARSTIEDARPAALEDIKVAPEGSMLGYRRAEFGAGWSRDDHGCTTREEIEQRDLADAQVRGCKVLSGRLTDPYDGTVLAFTASTSGKFDVDHVVSLGEAWRSGASRWTAAKRAAYANDPMVLLLVKSSENRSKGDDDPGQWQPAAAAGLCTYVRKVVEIKYHYHLTMDAREAAAVRTDLARC